MTTPSERARRAAGTARTHASVSRRRPPRISDPGDEAPSTTARFGVGCAIGCVALLLLAGALGIAVGLERRLAGWEDDDAVAGAPVDPVDPPGGADPTAADHGAPMQPLPPQARMRDRYRPGPYAEIESMVPSGQLLPPTTPTDVLQGRTVDNPWIVPGAELRPSAMPSPSPGGPSVAHDPGEDPNRPLTVLARTPARARVTARDGSGGTRVMAYVIDFVGYQGHFYLPATVQTELGAVTAGGSEGAVVQLAITAPVRPDGTRVAAGQRFDVTLRIGAVDDEGRVSSLIQRPLSVIAVGAGDVEVTLTMGEPTDLDLYVTDPTGVTIYFGNTDAFSGGHLDLDANAACSRNVGVDNEHVYWPRGQAPAGTYRVDVAHWRSCIEGRPVSYRVTVSACGETVVLAGRFDGGASTQTCDRRPGPTDRSWCQEVVTFDVPPCP